MRRTSLFLLLLLSFAAVPLTAEGAGGVEFIQVVGQDLWPFSRKSDLPERTGQLSAFGGLGYGVEPDGTVMGGFGFSTADEPSRREFGGVYGGTIQGWQHRWGPLVGLFTTRTGAGVARWDGSYGFSLLGTAGAQMSVTIFPWFAVGFEAGMAGTLSFLPGEPWKLGYAPTVAMRFLWGAF